MLRPLGCSSLWHIRASGVAWRLETLLINQGYRLFGQHSGVTLASKATPMLSQFPTLGTQKMDDLRPKISSECP